MSQENNDKKYRSPDFVQMGGKAVGTVEKIITGTGAHMEGYVAPVRETVLKRYPIISALLVTVGATATFLGLEKIFSEIQLFEQNPEILFFLGVAILALTGRLYKKLG